MIDTSHTKFKDCAICGGLIRRGTKRPKAWRELRTCSKECAQKLRAQTIEDKYGIVPCQDPARVRNRKKQMKRAKELIVEGKRAPVENYIRKTYAPRSEENSPKYLAQRAHDMAVDAKYDVKPSPIKIYTPEEIQAIAGQITPIERVRSTTKQNILFAEVDSTMSLRRRHEETSSLFGGRA